MRAAGRGSALLVTTIAMAIIMVIVVGVIRFTESNRAGAASKLRGDRVSACAEAARQHLLSRLQLFNIDPTTLVVDTTLPDDPTVAKQTQIKTGHFDDPLPQVTIIEARQSVSVANDRTSVMDITNRISLNGGRTGRPWRAVVKCQEPIPAGAPTDFVPRETELEFQFRYGVL
ncbi:MAG: hypothetical protein ACKVPX_17535 [Myxococcaceae bacterium]